MPKATRGWHAHPENKYKVGWLQDQKRRDRRDREDTLTGKEVGVFIEKIETSETYSKLSLDNNAVVKLRDKAVFALWWIFFKRGGEMLSLRCKDINVMEDRLVVTYAIEKKKRFVLICAKCGYENRRNHRKDADDVYVVCKKCSRSLQDSIRETRKELVTSLKRRSLKDPMTAHILAWKEHTGHAAAGPNSWFFPKFQYFQNRFVWDSEKPLSIQWLDWMLQKTDKSLTSSMARYGHTEQLLKAKTEKGAPKYSIDAITRRGDWESYDMPMRYAQKKGLTQQEIEFEEDYSR